MAEERTVIKSKRSSGIKILCIVLIVIGLIAGLILVFNSPEYRWHRGASYFFLSIVPYYFAMSFLPFLIVSGIIYFVTANCELTVTTSRVFGQAIFRKRVDLPIDSISAVSTSALQGISIATSAGRITFLGIENNIAIRESVSELLMERQEKKSAPVQTTVVKESNLNEAEQLKQFKELLDSGAITQEEYDAKKKQILGL